MWLGVWSKVPNAPAVVPTRDSPPILSPDNSQNMAPERPLSVMYLLFCWTISGVS